MWYLLEELVAFVLLFDERVSIETKRKMLDPLETEEIEYPLKYVSVALKLFLQKI